MLVFESHTLASIISSLLQLHLTFHDTGNAKMKYLGNLTYAPPRRHLSLQSQNSSYP